MADNLFFSRDTRVVVSDDTTRLLHGRFQYLDGFSFSQATNTSEITLSRNGIHQRFQVIRAVRGRKNVQRFLRTSRVVFLNLCTTLSHPLQQDAATTPTGLGRFTVSVHKSRSRRSSLGRS